MFHTKLSTIAPEFLVSPEDPTEFLVLLVLSTEWVLVVQYQYMYDASSAILAGRLGRGEAKRVTVRIALLRRKWPGMDAFCTGMTCTSACFVNLFQIQVPPSEEG